MNKILSLLLLLSTSLLCHAHGGGNYEWKEMLEKEGFTVSAQLEGLGQIPEIQEIFIDHIRFGLKHRMLDIMTKKAAYAAGKDTE